MGRLHRHRRENAWQDRTRTLARVLAVTYRPITITAAALAATLATAGWLTIG